MRQAKPIIIVLLVLVLGGCVTPIDEAMERAGAATGPGYTIEPADAFGGITITNPNGTTRYIPPNITIRRMRAAQVQQ